MDNLLAYWYLFNTASNWLGMSIVASLCIVLSFVAILKLNDDNKEEIAMSLAMISMLVWVFSSIVAVVDAGGFGDRPSSFPKSYRSRIAHQETVKPYRYYLDGDKLYYQLSKNDKQSTDKIDHKVIKLSDHKQGTAVYGKRWVADKGATKAERQLVKQQEIVWYKTTYKQGSTSNGD